MRGLGPGYGDVLVSAGRMDVTLNDVTRTFDENKVSMAELHNYLRSVGNFAVDRQVLLPLRTRKMCEIYLIFKYKQLLK